MSTDPGHLLCEQALCALDIPVLLLDASFATVKCNPRWQTLCAGGQDLPRGTALDRVAALLASGSLAARSGMRMTATSIARAVRNAPCKIALHSAGMEPLILRAQTLPQGHVMVTVRTPTPTAMPMREVQERLEEVIESLDDGIVLYDESLILRMSNAAAHRLAHGDAPAMPYGSSLAEHCAYTFSIGHLDLPDGMDAAAFTKMIVAAVRDCASGMVFARKDGTVVDFSAQRTRAGGYLVLMRDVTEQHARARTDAQMRTIVESLGEGLILLDRDLRIVLSNPAIWGMTLGDGNAVETGTLLQDGIRGAIDQGVLPVPDGRTAEALVDDIVGAMRRRERDAELILSGDRIISFSAFDAPDDGTLLLVRDVSDKRRAQRAADEANALLRTIVEASPTTFLVTRFDDGEIVFMPRPSLERFGRIASARHFFLDPEDRRAYLAALSETGSLTDYPVRFRRADGSVMDGLTSARIVEYGGERLIVSSTRDITDQLAMQAELERQREIAHQNEKLSALGGLLAGVAHELNNPLSIVLTNTAMLQEDLQDPRHKARIDRVGAAAERCSRIVRAFLAMARNRPAQVDPVPVAELLAQALELGGCGLRASGVRVEASVPADLPPIAADRDQILQVFCNVILNAEHAICTAGTGGRLRIAARTQPPDMVRIRFEDSGPGIPEGQLRRIFEPYFTTKGVGEGTGLGLAYCRKIVTSHDGAIEASNLPSGGAAIVIDLPVAAASERATATRPRGDGPAWSGGAVLLVDDDADALHSHVDLLTRSGFRVSTAGNGEQALRLCGRLDFDAVVGDATMPDMDGIAFLSALTRLRPDLAARFGFLSGGTIPGRAEALSATGRPLCDTPRDPAAFVAFVARLCAGDAG